MAIRTILAVLAAVLAAGLASAQVTSINGVVTDSSGAVISGARVRAVPADGGTNVTTLSNSQGIYHLPSLFAADYVVRVDSDGFAPAEVKITLLVGQTRTIDLQLHPAATSTAVEVTADVSAVSTTTSEVAANIDARQMQQVPLNGRNWIELALLLPGISKNDVAGNTIVNGPDTGKYEFNVDGQQVSQDIAGSGTGQPLYSRETLSEFQIITNRFDATQGRSSVSQINAETKSGTDNFHGSGWGYFRSNHFNAADPVAHKVLPFQDQQYGASLGGPVLRDKLWFFAAFEGERQPATIFTTPTGFGGLTYQLPTQTTTRSYLARLDYQKSESNRLYLRLSAFTTKNPFTGVSGTTHPSRGALNSQKNYSLLLDWSKTWTPHLVNDVKAGFSYFSYFNQQVVSSQEYRFGSTTVGGNYNYPSPHDENNWQFRDDAYWLKGSHSVKLGGEYLNIWYHGAYPQSARGTVTSFSTVPSNLASYFPVWNDPSTWNLAGLGAIANSYLQAFGNFAFSNDRNTVGFWLQDDWKLNSRLTLNLGLRYDNDLGIMGDSLYLKSGLVTPHRGDNNNIAPRLGFAWDLFGDRRTIIRGGGGLYYADLQANQYYDQQLFNGQTTIQASVDAAPGAPINLLQPFGNVTGDQFLNGTAPVPKQAVQLVDPAAQTPYTAQASIGIEKQIGREWTVSANYVYWRLYHEWIRVDQNLSYNPATGFNVNPNVSRPNPNFTQILRFTTPNAAGAIYNGLLIDVRRQFAKRLSLAASYTLAHAKDSSDGPFYVPNNQFNLSDEWSNQTGDQRHTLNLDGNFQWKWGLALSALYHFGSGAAYQITAAGSPFGLPAPAGGGASNRTFLTTTKVYDSPSLNYVDPIDPVYSIVQRNGAYGRPVQRVDARLSKTITFRERYRLVGQLEAFNLLNHSNFGTYQAAITSSSFTAAAQNSNLAYAPRMLQLGARFEF